MSWRDELRPGSFREVPFEVEAADQDGGRRQVVHEFAQRDDVFVEDLGLKPHEFRIDGYVLGAGYMAKRDALIAALDAPGSGALVHPYRGALTVACLRWSVRESAREGGIALFDMVFVRTAVAAAPSQVEDTGAGVETAAAAASAEGQAGFGRGFSVASLPDFVAQSAANQVSALGDRLSAGLGRLGGAKDALSNAALRIRSLRADALSLVRRVPDLSGAVFDLVTSARLLAATPRQALRELSALIRFEPVGPAWRTTPARRAEAANTDALARLVTLTASAEAAVAVAGMTFDSYDDAVEIREALADRIDAAAANLADFGDDAAYQRLNALRLAVVRDVTVRGGSLSRLQTYAPAGTEPALVIAHRLYGDADRAAEITARNRIRHPGFVQGGRALEVLTDG